MDNEYRDRVAAAVWEVILKASISDVAGADGQRVAVVQSGECVGALIRIMGVLLATSEASATPTRLRETCGEISKRLRSWTATVRADGTAHQIFDRVVQGATQ
jgi:hypothetical protein